MRKPFRFAARLSFFCLFISFLAGFAVFKSHGQSDLQQDRSLNNSAVESGMIPEQTELAVDDGTFETTLGRTDGGISWRVNRLTPTSYPATINAVSVFFRSNSRLTVGDPLTIVFAANPGGGANINGIQLQEMAGAVQSLSAFNVYNIPPLTINSGDFVVGYKITHADGVYPFSLDTTPPSQRRSYRSLDGATFTINDDISQNNVGNYGIRARLQTTQSPMLTLLSPNSVIAGGPAFTLTLTGTNFTPDSVVRWNGGDRPTTFVSATQLQAMIPASDIAAAGTASVTVFAPGGGLSGALSFTINPANLTGFARGDVFVSVNNGRIQWRRANGTLVQTLSTGEGGIIGGMAFDKLANLYVTSFSVNKVHRFSVTGALLGTFGSGYECNPESIVFDFAGNASGNAYVGQAGPQPGQGNCNRGILQFDDAGTLLKTFTPAIESRGTDWIELARDQCTLFYTSEGKTIKRFNVCANTQLPDFATGLPGANAFALRLLPDNEGSIVGDSAVIVRLDASGRVVGTYDAPGEDSWFAVNLDPDRKSFWSAGLYTGNVYKFDLATGSQLLSFNTGTPPQPGTREYVNGLAILGEFRPGENPPTGGAVIIDGTDANDHGDNEGPGGSNRNGWLYMQKALENLGGQVPAGSAKLVIDLGTQEGTKARRAIDSAFNLSGLRAAGWEIRHVDGPANITNWLANLSGANTGILYLPTYNQCLGGTGECTGDLDAQEMAAINAQAGKIANFIGRDNGALFAMGESNRTGATGAWGWLKTLFPLINPTDLGPGSGSTTEITLTPEGQAAFPGLTNRDLAGADPWHNYFTGNLGTLKVLGTAPQGGATRNVIIGGRGIVVPEADLAITKTASPDPVNPGADLTWTIMIRNDGPDEATAVTVTDSLPAGTSFVSCNATGSGVCGGSGASRSITFSSLAAGASAMITLVAKVTCSPCGPTISNTATVASAYSDPVAGNNSATATSTVNSTSPPRTVRVVCGNASSGGTVNVPIVLDSQGDENALGFSLNFDPAVLSNPRAALGGDAAGAILNVNSGQVGQGRLGIALALPSGQSFATGARQIAVVTFTVANTNARVDFGDAPISRQVSNANAQLLNAGYQGCTVTIGPGTTDGYEADVTPRPSGKNNGTIAITDWVQVGRFAAGLDTATAGGEFQRADCAPRDTKGDGQISITDWVQAGRYAAGLDPVQRAGGPTNPVGLPLMSMARSAAENAHARVIRVLSAAFQRGQANMLEIEMEAEGDENALGFSLNFDPGILGFVSASAGSGVSNAQLNVNANQTANGRLGIALALPAGQKMKAGKQTIVSIRFNALAGSRATTMPLGFGDQPLRRQLSDLNAFEIAASYSDGSITIGTGFR